jgi:hypothetical protein
MRLTWHGGYSNSIVVHIVGNTNYAKNRTPKPLTLNETCYVRSLYTEGRRVHL